MIGAAFLLFLGSPWLNAAGLILGCAHIFYQVSGRRQALAPQGLSGELEG